MLNGENYKNIVSLFLSEESESGYSGDQPARNSLTNWNGRWWEYNIPQSIFPFQLLMPKKTHCFDRSKKKKKKTTCINKKKGQRIWGQDTLCRRKKRRPESELKMN